MNWQHIWRVLCAFLVLCISGLASQAQTTYDVGLIFNDKNELGIESVRNAAQSQSTSTPYYKSNAVETKWYEGYFRAASNQSKLALLSDDGASVWIDGEQVLNRAGQNQGFEDFNSAFYPLAKSFTEGQIYHLKIQYTNTIHLSDADVDGISIWAYDGGGDVVSTRLEIVGSRSKVVAGGWNEDRKAFEYLEKESGTWRGRTDPADPHITTLSARLVTETGAQLPTPIQFEWDMPGPAPAQNREVNASGNGWATCQIVSGDEISTSPVAITVKAGGQAKEFPIEVVSPKDNWSPLEISPDQQGLPTIRISLSHDERPVTGHPISWGIDKIEDETGAVVPSENWSQYVTLSGPVSTTNASGEAVAYLQFGTEQGKIFFSATDNSVYVPSSAPTPFGAQRMNTIPQRAKETYRKTYEWGYTFGTRIDNVADHQSKVTLSPRPQLTKKNGIFSGTRYVVVEHTMRFEYIPHPDYKIEGSVNLQISNNLLSDPVTVSVPLGEGEVTAQLGATQMSLSESDKVFYRSFVTSFAECLWDDYRTLKPARRTLFVLKGYGMAAINGVSGTVQLAQTLLPYATNPSKFVTVYIQGAEFVLDNQAQIRSQINANLAQMPSRIQKLANDPKALQQSFLKAANISGRFLSKTFNDLTIYAANNPDGFAENTGLVAGTATIALASRRVAIPKIPGTPGFPFRTLARINARATTTLNTFQRGSGVIYNTTTQRFADLAKGVMQKVRPVKRGNELVAEADTSSVIAASSRGWTSRLRVRHSPGVAKAEAGKIKPFCFPAGTLIQMSDGSLRPIENVKENDKVKSRDEATGQNSIQKVTQLFRRQAQATLRFRFSNGEVVESTPEHPFFVPGKGFRAARYLAVGLAVATLSQPIKVEAVQRIEKTQTVYNFAVDNTHTYFVGKTGLWVHNQCSLKSKLKVTLLSPRYAPSVTPNQLSQKELALARKMSSFRRGQHAVGQTPRDDIPAIDGWWNHQGGRPFALKEVGDDSLDKTKPKKVLDLAKLARAQARNANYHGREIDLYIDAPEVDPKDLLNFIGQKPGMALDDIAKNNGLIGRITVFCKNGIVVELEP